MYCIECEKEIGNLCNECGDKCGDKESDKAINVMCCTICQRKGPTRYLPLYITGSEGLDVCPDCEIDLVHHVRALMYLAGVARKSGQEQAIRKYYASAKDIAKATAT